MLNPSKCSFGIRTGKFLGFEVTPRGIEVNKDKVKAILDMHSPRNVQEVQALNGGLAALSHFISRSTDKSLPFFKVLMNGSKFDWNDKCQLAFEELKSYLADLPVLIKPIPWSDLILYLAVGDESLGTVLVSEEGEQQRPVYFVSKALQGSELHCTELEKAALAIKTTTKKLRPYFLSHKVIVRTALPIRQVLGRSDSSGRLTKWVIELSEYEIEYEPRKAIKAQALADFIQETTRGPKQRAG